MKTNNKMKHTQFHFGERTPGAFGVSSSNTVLSENRNNKERMKQLPKFNWQNNIE